MPIIDVRDSFDGGSGDLAGRVPDQIAGAPWAALPGQSGPPLQETGAGYIELAGPGGGSFSPTLYVVGAPRTPNYRVKGNTQGLRPPGWDTSVGVIVRAVDVNNWCGLVTDATGMWQLIRYTGGSPVMLASNAFAFAAGDFARILELAVSGTQLTALVDGVQVAQVTDPGLAATGRGGIYAQISNTAGVFARVHDFEVAEMVNPLRLAA